MQVDEIFDADLMPPHLDNTYIRPPGITAPDLIKFKVPPTNNLSEFDVKYNKIHFTLNTSSNLLDPYALYFEFEVENVNPNPIQLDNSAHSIISDITVLSNGQVIEKISDYDFLQSLCFDMQLTKKQRRKRKENEGFGDNEWGTNETIIPPKNPEYDKHYKYNFENLYKLVKGYGSDPNSGFSYPGSVDNVPLSKLIDDKDKIAYKNLDPKSQFLEHGYDIPDMAKWKYVINGKLSPFPYKIEEKARHRNIKAFRIPLMLKTIGFGQQTNNYKLVPLELFGILTIVITLNPDAFFVPMELKEYQYFKKDVMKIDEVSSDVKYGYESRTNFGLDPKNAYKLKNCYIHTEQYRFVPSVHSKILNQVRAGGWVLDYVDMEIIDQVYCKNYPTVSYTKAISRKNVKSIYMIFTNDLYKHSKYARKLSRYNKGIKNLTFKQAGAQYPPNTNVEYNSLNSHGSSNAQFFYHELLKSFGRGHFDEESFINLTNFCLDHDTSHNWAIAHLTNSEKKKPLDDVGGMAIVQENNTVNVNPIMIQNRNIGNIPIAPRHVSYDDLSFTDKEWTNQYFSLSKLKFIHNSLVQPQLEYIKRKGTNFGEIIPNISSKCIYALNFETVPHSSGLYRTGISTSFNVPFILETERLADYIYTDEWFKLSTIYFFQWVVFEYYTTIQLNSEGVFARIS